jgi:hypothetical protein
MYCFVGFGEDCAGAFSCHGQIGGFGQSLGFEGYRLPFGCVGGTRVG